MMATNHVRNKHVTNNGRHVCLHADLDETELEPEWLTAGSDAHKAEQDVVLSARTLALSKFVASFRYICISAVHLRIQLSSLIRIHPYLSAMFFGVSCDT